MNTYKRLTISAAIACVAHATILALPRVFTSSAGSSPALVTHSLNDKTSIADQAQLKRPTEIAVKDKTIAARVTSNDEKLEMNNGSEREKKSGVQASESKANMTVNIEANVDEAKYVSQKKKEYKTLKQVIEETSRQEKQTLKSTMSRSDYLRFKQSMNYGRMKGVPTPNLAFAYKDLSEILTVHNVFGIKVVALDPQRPSTVVELAGLGTGNPYCQKIESFNGKAYSNRVYRRTEPFFAKYMPSCQKRLASDSAILISMTPADTDAYFRYKILEVIKRNGYNADNVSTAIAKFYKTSFSAMILVIEKLHMKDGAIRNVNDFERERITKG